MQLPFWPTRPVWRSFLRSNFIFLTFLLINLIAIWTFFSHPFERDVLQSELMLGARLRNLFIFHWAFLTFFRVCSLRTKDVLFSWHFFYFLCSTEVAHGCNHWHFSHQVSSKHLSQALCKFRISMACTLTSQSLMALLYKNHFNKQVQNITTFSQILRNV